MPSTDTDHGRDSDGDDIHSLVATYVAVFEQGPMGLQLQDAASTCGVRGVKVCGLKERALGVGTIAVGDMLCRVNHVDVLDMPYVDVMIAVKDASTPRVLEFVPQRQLADLQRLVARRTARREEAAVQRTVESQYTVLRRGEVYVQDRSLDRPQKWRYHRVMLRATGIECVETALWSQLGFVGKRCDARVLPPRPEEVVGESPYVAAKHVLELRVGEDVWALALPRYGTAVAWRDALTLAFEASKALDRNAERDRNGALTIPQLDRSQAVLLKRLLEREEEYLRGLSSEEMMMRVRQLDARMESIAALDGMHPDALIQSSLRDEYARLEHDRRVYEQESAVVVRTDREWEGANAAANVEALRAVRRCMPVDVKNRSEADLSAMVTPSGECMSEEMARHFKRTNVLELLRVSPTELLDTHPSSLENLRCDGLTLTERRALHVHLREVAETWRVAARTDDAGIEKRKWEWFSALKRTFQRVLDAYERHVAQFGPPGDHAYASEENESSVGCPLRDKQCPLIADRSPAYEIDLGFPDGDVFYESTVQKGPPDSTAGILTPHEYGEDVDGFLVASAEATYGASSIWTDPALLRLRLEGNDLETSKRVSPLSCNASSSVLTEVYSGTYGGTPVAIKRLATSGSTVANAEALATACTTFHRVTHANLVPLIGLHWTKALDLQVVTPWKARGDLRSVLDSSEATSLTWADFKCQVAIDVASALTLLHLRCRAAGLGALTSRNVLLDDNGAASLNLMQLPCVDLGAARDRVPSPVRYVAPEVVLGGASTRKSDMYALGVLLTELDTTKVPFKDAVNPNGKPMEDMLIAFRVARRNMRPTLSPDCPDAISTLVESCLTQDPEQRPSAASVEYELRGILKNEL